MTLLAGTQSPMSNSSVWLPVFGGNAAVIAERHLVASLVEGADLDLAEVAGDEHLGLVDGVAFGVALELDRRRNGDAVVKRRLALEGNFDVLLHADAVLSVDVVVGDADIGFPRAADGQRRLHHLLVLRGGRARQGQRADGRQRSGRKELFLHGSLRNMVKHEEGNAGSRCGTALNLLTAANLLPKKTAACRVHENAFKPKQAPPQQSAHTVAKKGHDCGIFATSEIQMSGHPFCRPPPRRENAPMDPRCARTWRLVLFLVPSAEIRASQRRRPA